jgi:hypothetical protein
MRSMVRRNRGNSAFDDAVQRRSRFTAARTRCYDVRVDQRQRSRSSARALILPRFRLTIDRISRFPGNLWEGGCVQRA